MDYQSKLSLLQPHGTEKFIENQVSSSQTDEALSPSDDSVVILLFAASLRFRFCTQIKLNY